MELHTGEYLAMVDLIGDKGQLMVVTEGENLLHVAFGEDGAHGVGGIDDEQKLGPIGDKGCSVFEIDAEIIFNFEFVVFDGHPESRGQLLENRIADLGHQDLIALVGERDQGRQQSLVNSVLNYNLSIRNRCLGIIKFGHCLPRGRHSR